MHASIVSAISRNADERLLAFAALQKAANADREYLTGAEVRRRYGVSDMTVWRWLNDDRVGFPKPMMIARRRYFRIADLIAWEAKQKEVSP